MKKRFLSFALSILLLFAFGCAGATAQSDDNHSSGDSVVITGTQDEGTQTGKTQKSGIKQTAAPETETVDTEAGEDADESFSTTPLWFGKDSFLKILDDVAEVYDVILEKGDMTDDEGTDEKTEDGVTTSVYQFIDANGATHAGIFIIENEQGVCRIMLYTSDATTYGDEMKEMASWLVRICDMSLIEQESEAVQVVTDTFDADGSYVKGDYRYIAGTTEDNLLFFVAEAAE